MSKEEKHLPVISGNFGSDDPPPPRKPVIQQDSLQSFAMVEFVDGICEGEIEGFATTDPLMSVYLNNTPLRSKNGNMNFNGVTIDYRLGTQNQTYMPGQSSGGGVSIETLVNSKVTVDTPVVRTINSVIVDAIIVTVEFKTLQKRDMTNGDVYGTKVELKIEVRASGKVAFSTVNLGGKQIVSGKSTGPYDRSFHIPLFQFGKPPYDIRVSRVTPEVKDGSVYDEFWWKSYTEVTYSKLRYPNTVVARVTFDAKNFSQPPRRGYLLKGLKVRVPGPQFYDPVARTYTGADWDGTFVMAWTRCPAWIFFDIITDKRYGLGNEIPEQYIDKWSLWQIAKRCDEMVPDGFGGTEHRYSLDLYLQAEQDAKKVVQDIASNFAAMTYWGSGGIHITQDAPKSISALYTPANVVNGRFIYSSSSMQTRYTVALVQWNDPDDFYKVATEYVEDIEGIKRYGYREKKIVAVGCTSRGQAHREGVRFLTTSRMETDSVTFSVGLSGMIVKPGDIIRVSDPLRHDGKRMSGRVIRSVFEPTKISNTVRVTNVITLDSLVDIQVNDTYTICVIDPDGNVDSSTISTSTVNQDGKTVVALWPPLKKVPDESAVWSIYSGKIPSKEYRVLWTEEKRENDESFYEISAIQYNVLKYRHTDANFLFQTNKQSVGLNKQNVSAPSNMSFVDGSISKGGTWIGFLDVGWEKPRDPLFSHFSVVWSKDNGIETSLIVNTSSFRIDNTTSGTYKVRVASINVFNIASAFIEGSHTVVGDIDVDLVVIENIALKNGDQPNSFSGNDVEITWDTNLLNTGVLLSAFADPAQVYVPRYKVYVYSGTTLLRSELTTSRSYNYTYNKNVEDGGPTDVVTFKIHPISTGGIESSVSIGEITVSKSKTMQYATPHINVNGSKVFVTYNHPSTEKGYKKTRIFASQIPGFTPDATPVTGNLVAEGDSSVMSFDAPSHGNIYIRLQGVGQFGPAQNYSQEYSVSVAPPMSLLTSETGTATDGQVVTLSNKYTTAPTIVVSPYNINMSIASNSTMIVDATNIVETSPGSRTWKFTAVAKFVSNADSSVVGTGIIKWTAMA